MATIFRMPSLSPTMEEGIIESWTKEVGDFFESGDVLANIETDKAVVEYESISEGYLRHLIAKAGEEVPVGKPIAIISEEADDPIEELLKEAQAELAGESTAEATNTATPANPSTHESAVSSSSATTTETSHHFDVDVAVIGAGPGGYVAAIRGAQLGQKVALIDKEWLGGVCLNVGCIPSKSLLKSADVIHTIQHKGEEYGFSVSDVKVDFSVAVERSRKASQKLTQGVAYLTKKNNIDVRMASASFVDQHTLALTDSDGNTSTLTAKNVIIATGATARSIPSVTVDGQKILTYWEAILQKTCPKSVVIVGSGAIGVEFATIWRAYGVEVTIVEMLPNIVPLEDADVSKELTKAFKKEGIKIMTSTKVESIDSSGTGVTVSVSNAQGSQKLEAEQVLIAIGFVPNVDGFGLEKIGVALERGAIVIDEKMQTNVPNVYAIGDVTAKLMLAHVGSAMGIIAAEAIAGHPTIPLQYEMMPRATYCHPQIASFGLTEAQAKERGYQPKVALFPFSANGKSLGMGNQSGFVKIIIDAKYDEILGAHMIGPEVTELLPELTLAQSAELTIEEIARNVHAHPTLSETLMEAAHGLVGGYIHL